MRPLSMLTSALVAIQTIRGDATCADGIGDDKALLDAPSWRRTKTQGHDRHHDIAERLSKRASGQSFAPYSTQHGMCVDVQNGKLAPGSRVQLWQCSGGANQAWRIEGPLFQTGNDMCLDVPHGNAYNGAPLQIWKCDGQNKNQQWSQLGNSLQWAGAQQYCVDVPNGWFQNGNLLQLWTCYAGSANQGFTMNNGASAGVATSGSASAGATNFDGYNCVSLDAFVAKYPECSQWKGALQSAGADQGINPVFLGAIAMVESDCGAGLSGSANAKYGPFQFMDDGAWSFYGGSGKDRTNFWDASYGAARYFNALLKQDNNNLYQAMRDWNGPVSSGGDPNYQANVAGYMSATK